jgi:hypothetical protein
MTSILPPVATGACVRPSGSLDRTGVPPSSGWSRDGSRVSQERDGWPQIQLHLPEGALQHGMISAMHEPPDYRLPDWSSDCAGYTSAYRSSYTVVYTKAKEVS